MHAKYKAKSCCSSNCDWIAQGFYLLKWTPQTSKCASAFKWCDLIQCYYKLSKNLLINCLWSCSTLPRCINKVHRTVLSSCLLQTLQNWSRPAVAKFVHELSIYQVTDNFWQLHLSSIASNIFGFDYFTKILFKW